MLFCDRWRHITRHAICLRRQSQLCRRAYASAIAAILAPWRRRRYSVISHFAYTTCCSFGLIRDATRHAT